MSSVRYETGFYIPEGGIFHSHLHENLTSNLPLIACVSGKSLNIITCNNLAVLNRIRKCLWRNDEM
jgi:hypothetical protein